MPKPIKNTTKEHKISPKKLLSLISDLELKPKQLKFIVEYVNNHFDGRRAYINAGYKGTTEEVIDSRVSMILRDVRVREGLHRYLEDILESGKVNLSKKLFDTWFILAFYDPSMFINPDGTLAFTVWEDIPVEYRQCVESIETKYYGRDADTEVIVLKLIDRKWAQTQLDKYVGMTTDRKSIELVEIPQGRKKELGKIFAGKIEEDK